MTKPNASRPKSIRDQVRTLAMEQAHAIDLPTSICRIFAYLAENAEWDDFMTIRRKHQTIATAIGCKRRWVVEATQRLEAAGLLLDLERGAHRRGHGHQYEVLVDLPEDLVEVMRKAKRSNRADTSSAHQSAHQTPQSAHQGAHLSPPEHPQDLSPRGQFAYALSGEGRPSASQPEAEEMKLPSTQPRWPTADDRRYRGKWYTAKLPGNYCTACSKTIRVDHDLFTFAWLPFPGRRVSRSFCKRCKEHPDPKARQALAEIRNSWEDQPPRPLEEVSTGLTRQVQAELAADREAMRNEARRV